MTKKALELGTVKEEAAACRKAFEGAEANGWTLHCHHEPAFEIVWGPPTARIDYILQAKPPHELRIRLRLFRPVPKKYWKALDRAQELDRASLNSYCPYEESIAKIHSKVCIKECPWNGRTIFPRVKP